MTIMPNSIVADVSAQPDPVTAGERPRSAVSAGVGFVGLAALIGWFALARIYGMNGPNSALASVFVIGLAMALWSVLVDKVHRNPSTGIEIGRASCRERVSECV